ncbi:MAG: TonB C-terminal domain-containing protein [Deltaproteobacteria bacterium]|nr:TonB C-terminal domain-containing protein [Deltaproteobacteria bacterium]
MRNANPKAAHAQKKRPPRRFVLRWGGLPPFLGIAILIHILLILPMVAILVRDSNSSSPLDAFDVDLWSTANTSDNKSRQNAMDDDAIVVDMPDNKSSASSTQSRFLSQHGSSSEKQTKNRLAGKRRLPNAGKRDPAQLISPANEPPPTPAHADAPTPSIGAHDTVIQTNRLPPPLPQPLKLRPDDTTLSTAITGSGLADLGDLEEGDQTSLNSAAFRHASFFTRVQRMVEQFWRPDIAMQKNDPEARIIGTKDRVTTLLVVLQADGRIHHLYAKTPSGAGFLDDEAIKAVRIAGPFPNVPSGLISSKDGLVKFLFQFTVEIDKKPAVRIRRYD